VHLPIKTPKKKATTALRLDRLARRLSNLSLKTGENKSAQEDADQLLFQKSIT